MKSEAFGVDATSFTSHELHSLDRIWPETNCYVDVWIELLHALKLDPVATMAFTVAMDFEGDQWTFFKPSLGDIHALYGIDVQELAIWRPLKLHIAEQLSQGRVPLVEVDAFYLPDTVGVSYQLEHTKTTVGAQAIDLDARTLGYFHSAGYFELGSSDFDAIFHVNTQALAPYTEFAKLDRITRLSPTELAAIARDQLVHYLARVPRLNPVTRYRARYDTDIKWLAGSDMTMFYKYAFATLRQFGACAELASTFLNWLSQTEGHATPASAAFETCSSAAKAMQFKLARMMATGRAVDVTASLDQMESAWESAIASLQGRYGN
ncbi:MAG: DUF1839 family protein [Gemmatimonadaceae bacterium]